MSIKISQLAKLKNLKRFNLLAGESGFEREVSSVCLADLELDNNLIPYANGFRRGSFVIASMRENEALKQTKFIDLVKRLLELNCSGLAFNTKMLKKPGKNVLEFCEKEGFPLFSFDPGETYIESVVFDIMLAIQKSTVSFSMNREIKYMLDGTMPLEDVENTARSINPLFHKTCTVSYIWPYGNNIDFNSVKIARTYGEKGNSDGAITSLLAYRNGIIVIVSMDYFDYKIRDEIINNLIESIGDKDKICVVTSGLNMTFPELDKALRECRDTYLTANIESKRILNYDDIGIYKLILPQRNRPEFVEFMNRYLKVMNREQLETAIAYVLCDGDYDKVSEKIICHRNTVRYRIGKIHDRTDPLATDYKFLENLSIAIKMYLAGKVK